MNRFTRTAFDLYQGRSRHARRFRLLLLTLDLFIIAFFIVASMFPEGPWMWVIDGVIALLLILDFAARFTIARSKARFFTELTTLADIIVIATLLASAFIDNWAFLRVLRALRLLRSYHVLRDLRERFAFFKANEGIIVSTVNLFVFIFMVTAFVYVLEAGVNSEINTYVDALYFTVTTLTTTGFGDITLEGSVGRMLAVVIMIVGVGLFLRLIQTIFRPNKVRYPCPDCGLSRHDPDAVHCKHCGRTLNIETEGD